MVQLQHERDARQRYFPGVPRLDNLGQLLGERPRRAELAETQKLIRVQLRQLLARRRDLRAVAFAPLDEALEVILF